MQGLYTNTKEARTSLTVLYYLNITINSVSDPFHKQVWKNSLCSLKVQEDKDPAECRF